MLEVGNGGMTPAEYRSHFSLWAMMASPLMAGNDIAHMDATTQVDPAQQGSDRGRPGSRWAFRAAAWRRTANSEVWVKPLAGGGRALLLFNRGDAPATIRATAEQVGWPAGVRAKVRDLWAHKDAGGWSGSIAGDGRAAWRGDVPDRCVKLSRRGLFVGTAAGAASLSLPVDARRPIAAPNATPRKSHWGRTFEGQRKADLGNGTYLIRSLPAITPTRLSSRTAGIIT